MAALYDGHSGVRHEVRVMGQPGLLIVDYGEGAVERVPVGELSVVDRSTGGLTIGRPAIDGWRLRIPPPVDADVDLLFPRRHGYGGWIDRVGLWPAVAAFAGASGLIVALSYFAPTLLAPLVPESVEQAYGDALVGDFGGKYCATPAGAAALSRLVGQLDGSADTLRVHVVDVSILNAAALPGRQIVIFRPLLATVESPDEFAGILAHEISHVRERHVTAALVRQFGFGLISSMVGGSVGGQVDGFVSLSFSRRAEREADDGAVARLRAARISPAPTARFFARLGGEGQEDGALASTMGYLSTHPLSKDREALFRKAAVPGVAYRPALTPAEWNALKMICAKPESG